MCNVFLTSGEEKPKVEILKRAADGGLALGLHCIYTHVHLCIHNITNILFICVTSFSPAAKRSQKSRFWSEAQTEGGRLSSISNTDARGFGVRGAGCWRVDGGKLEIPTERCVWSLSVMSISVSESGELSADESVAASRPTVGPPFTPPFTRSFTPLFTRSFTPE